MKYDRTVIAYHGCDASVAKRVLAGEPFKKSQNDYDWLGEGIYFWEYGADRAIKFAQDQKGRGKVKSPRSLAPSSSWATASTSWTPSSRRSCPWHSRC